MTEELRQDIHRRVAAVQRHYHEGGPVLRAVWVIASVVVIIAGIVMLVLPGPAMIVLPAGVAMLAARFHWAQRVLRTGIDHGVRLQRRFAARSRPTRLIWVTLAAAAALIVYLAVR